MDYFFSLLLLQNPWFFARSVMLIGHLMWMTGVHLRGCHLSWPKLNILVVLQTKGQIGGGLVGFGLRVVCYGSGWQLRLGSVPLVWWWFRVTVLVFGW